ncbi:MAG: NAD(P)H-dependent oxidoreductase [Chloroflexi bacterium]|nr:NAD(P)H-dependent oxidoreductase [Chloroflexota bacterium]
MPKAVHVLGFAGSLRKASYNLAVLRAAAELLPDGMSLEIFDLAPLPFYNGDLDVDGGPEPVRHFKQRLAAADALLIATPEYNYSIPAVLKNAIDWASRPPQSSPLNAKPLAIVGAGGRFGTVRAQLHLRQIAVFTNMLPLNKPEVMIPMAWEKFDAEGRLTDDATAQQIRALLEALLAWTLQLRAERS